MNVLEQQTLEHLCNLDSKIPNLTLRDVFAMSALNGFISGRYIADMCVKDIAELAYKQADEMIKVRKGE